MPILNKKEITTDQLTALNNVQANHGRTWKSVLLRAWSTGNYNHVSYATNEAADLQRLLNTLGQHWLHGIAGKHLRDVWVAHCDRLARTSDNYN